MSTRKYLRGIARARMERDGVVHVNSYLGPNWRNITNAYPGFHGKKKQKRGSMQPILIYPMPPLGVGRRKIRKKELRKIRRSFT